jgi:hypothetical protein
MTNKHPHFLIGRDANPSLMRRLVDPTTREVVLDYRSLDEAELDLDFEPLRRAAKRGVRLIFLLDSFDPESPSQVRALDRLRTVYGGLLEINVLVGILTPER